MKTTFLHISFLLFALLFPCAMSAMQEQPDSIVTSDADGKQVEKVVFHDDAVEDFVWNPASGGWQLSVNQRTSCDEEGRIVLCERCEHDAKGSIIAGEKGEYAYSGDENSDVVVKTCFRWNVDKCSWQDSLRVKVVIAFDEQGRNVSNTTYQNLPSATGYANDWQLVCAETFAYDENGRIEKVYCQQGEDKPQFLFCQYEYEGELNTQYVYQQADTNGEWTTFLSTTFTSYQPTDGSEAAVITQEFDNEGNQLSANSLTNISTNGVLDAETIKSVAYTLTASDPLASSTIRTLYTYDSYSNLSTRDLYTYDAAQGEWTFNSRTTYFYKYTQTAIQTPESPISGQSSAFGSQLSYNVAGQRVADGYRGIVIKNSKKISPRCQ